MKKKNVTIEGLAGMVQKGFEETAKNFELTAKRDEVNARFDRIEKLILANHKRRIEKLESEVKELKELLAIK